MKILGNKLLIEPVEQINKTPSGLHVVEAQPNQMHFRVLQVGPGYRAKNGELVPIPIRAGQMVIAHSFQGDRLHLPNGQKIIDAGEVLAVFES